MDKKVGIAGLSFYHDQPLFGLDIGSSSMKVMQLSPDKARVPRILGYGVSDFYPRNSTAEGVVVNKKALGESLYELLSKRLNGQISTKRVAATIPSSHTFSRPMKLPHMEGEELTEAVKLEVEQYVPVPVDQLYMGYEVSRRDAKEIELLSVAIPKKIVDSYVDFLQTMGLEPVSLEPTMNALARLFSAADPSHDMPSIMIDLGSVATDLAVFDKSMFVNSTMPSGSDNLLDTISNRMHISVDQARQLKNEKGIGGETEISSIAKPMLDNLVKEIQKIIRYYNERSTPAQHTISQIVLMGGGSTTPGLGQYLSKQLGMPARMLDPWPRLDFGNLPSPGQFDRPMYLTVAGVAMLRPTEIFV